MDIRPLSCRRIGPVSRIFKGARASLSRSLLNAIPADERRPERLTEIDWAAARSVQTAAGLLIRTARTRARPRSSAPPTRPLSEEGRHRAAAAGRRRALGATARPCCAGRRVCNVMAVSKPARAHQAFLGETGRVAAASAEVVRAVDGNLVSISAGDLGIVGESGLRPKRRRRKLVLGLGGAPVGLMRVEAAICTNRLPPAVGIPQIGKGGVSGTVCLAEPAHRGSARSSPNRLVTTRNCPAARYWRERC